MKYVAFYNKHSYAVSGNVTYHDPSPILGVADVDSTKGNIFQQASQTWLEQNVPVGRSDGYDTEAEALASAKAELATYYKLHFG